MPSIYDMTRSEHAMTGEEMTELRESGWHPEVIGSLYSRGFRPCKPDYVAARFEGIDISRTMGFIRQTTHPHLFITVANDLLPHVVLERIDTAIAEAAHLQGHEQLAAQFMRFFDSCKHWKPSPDLSKLEARLSALENAKSGASGGSTD